MAKDMNYIYALIDPRTDDVRYVGKTVDLRRRIARHMHAEKSGLYRDRWLNGLVAEGLQPTFLVLAVVADDEWRAAERWWIAHFREIGAPLTNLTDGGDGAQGFQFQEGQNRGVATPGRPKPEGFGEKVSDGLKRYWESPEGQAVKERQRDHGVHLVETYLSDPDVNARALAAAAESWKRPERLEAAREQYSTPEMRAEMSRRGSLAKGVAKSQQTRERMAEAARNRPKTPCTLCGKEFTSPSMVLHLRAHARQSEASLDRSKALCPS